MSMGVRGSLLVDAMIGILLTSAAALTLGAYMAIQKRTDLHLEDTAEFRSITHRLLYDLNRTERCSFALSGVTHNGQSPIPIQFRSKNGPIYRSGYEQPGVRISRLDLRILGPVFQQNSESGDTALAQIILEGEKTRNDLNEVPLGGRGFRPVFFPVLVRMEPGGARIDECVQLKGSGAAVCPATPSGEPQTVVGFTPVGNPVCAPLALAEIAWNCPPNHYLVGVNGDQPVCRSFTGDLSDRRHSQARWGTSGSLPPTETAATPVSCAGATIETRELIMELPAMNEHVCAWAQGDALPERIGHQQAYNQVSVSRALAFQLAPGERLCGVRAVKSQGALSYDRQAALMLNGAIALLRGQGARLQSFPQSPDGLRPWRWSSLRGQAFQADVFEPQTQCACAAPGCCSAPAPGDAQEISIAFDADTSRAFAQRAELDGQIKLGLALTGDAAPARCRFSGNRRFSVTLEIGR